MYRCIDRQTDGLLDKYLFNDVRITVYCLPSTIGLPACSNNGNKHINNILINTSQL